MIIINDPQANQQREDLYLALRRAEGRVLSDAALLQLPYPANSEAHVAEWRLRAKNFSRLLRYLSAGVAKKPSVLDLGCGNGWMSHQLYQNGFNVTAVDLNLWELQQAERVFGNHPSLQWMYADIFSEHFPARGFDWIILGASCQYFPDLEQLTGRLRALLGEAGEIHLFDSMFYPRKELTEAKRRSADYYKKLGFPEMEHHYFHHSKEQLQQLGYRNKEPHWFLKPKTLDWWYFKNPASAT